MNHVYCVYCNKNVADIFCKIEHDVDKKHTSGDLVDCSICKLKINDYWFGENFDETFCENCYNSKKVKFLNKLENSEEDIKNHIQKLEEKIKKLEYNLKHVKDKLEETKCKYEGRSYNY